MIRVSGHLMGNAGTEPVENVEAMCFGDAAPAGNRFNRVAQSIYRNRKTDFFKISYPILYILG